MFSGTISKAPPQVPPNATIQAPDIPKNTTKPQQITQEKKPQIQPISIDENPTQNLTKIVVSVLGAIVLISLFVAVIYLVLQGAQQASGGTTLSATPSGGIGPFTYQWFSGTGCSGPIISTANTLTPTSGSSFSVLIIDSQQNTQCTNITNV